MNWMEIQARLAKLGFNPGDIDGIRGRKTIAAVKRFQEAKGLVADGIVGPKTLAALFGEAAASAHIEIDRMPWFDEARRLIGLTEAPGKANNPEIMEIAKKLDIDYPSDDIPWCGLFVAHCIGSQLPDESLPVNPLGARSWLKFGVPCEPQPGAILVFWRESKAGWKGHVGFYASEHQTSFHVLGGNQSNSVNIAKVEKSRLLGARWPVTALAPKGTGIFREEAGVTSGSEA